MIPATLTADEKARLLRWYESQKRDLLWRRTSDPYAIWVSEVMLQQTQVATVLPYYERWMAAFPTVEALAAAEEQEVLALWQGLGYYRRCRMLHAGGRHVQVNGMPASARDWKDVPGVGPYTAGAIASIALNEPAAVVDGNVERVYARIACDPAMKPELTKRAWKWAEANVHAERPGDWNQALMELGATVCRRVRPLCEHCPLSPDCVARRHGRENSLPKPAPKQEVVRLSNVVWVPWSQGQLGVRQIPEGQWWQGMWEFPREAKEDKLRLNLGEGCREHLGRVRHTVTNHRITVDAWLVRLEQRPSSLKWMAVEDLDDLPMPAPQRRILELARPHLA